jgi:hypothetical protein
MPRRSSIVRLDPRVREAVDRLVREDRATIDQIVAAIEDLGADVSRSSVGRYVKGAREQLEKYRRAQEVAKVWIARMGEEPDGDVGRLLAEMLRTVAFQTISSLDDASEEGAPSPGDIFFLAKSIRELAAADKTTADRELKVRDAVRKETERKLAGLEKQAGKGKAGLDMATLKRVREEVYGLV